MKKIFTQIALLLAVCTAAYAQPTITGAGSNPMAGETYYGHHFDTAYRNPGPSGAGVTWDYQTANVYMFDTLPLVTCSSTPYCDSFPGSTLAANDFFGGFDYFITDGIRFAANGYSSGGADNQHYSKPQTIIPFPFTYGNMRADSFSSAQYGLGYYSDGVDSFIADAYGTLKLPAMVFSNVLRIHHISYTRDSSADGSFLDHYRSESYIWMSPDVHFPLMMLFYDTIGTSKFISDIVFYTKAVTGVPALTVKDGPLQVYPNPSNGTVFARCTATQPGDATVIVTDLMGCAMLAPQRVYLNAGANEVSVDVSSMPRGVYMMQVNAGSERQVAKLVVE